MVYGALAMVPKRNQHPEHPNIRVCWLPLSAAQALKSCAQCAAGAPAASTHNLFPRSSCAWLPFCDGRTQHSLQMGGLIVVKHLDLGACRVPRQQRGGWNKGHSCPRLCPLV